jgi:hypothetical protein
VGYGAVDGAFALRTASRGGVPGGLEKLTKEHRRLLFALCLRPTQQHKFKTLIGNAVEFVQERIEMSSQLLGRPVRAEAITDLLQETECIV